jgi:hypothetical protein
LSAPGAAKPPYFGLVSIGHSFGGAVLLQATAQYFESQLQLVNREPGFLHPESRNRDDPNPQSAKPIHPVWTADKPIGGFGDMVILVNPAVESAAYERINILSRGIIYRSDQTPLLVTFSASNDGPRNTLFKAGRIAGEFFTNAAYVRDERERASLRQALGVYDYKGSGITHSLTPVGDRRLVSGRQSNSADPQCKGRRQGTFEWWKWSDHRENPDIPFPIEKVNLKQVRTLNLRSVDFSQAARYADVWLSPKTRVTPRQPFMVVSVDRRIIDGHNGIFTEPFMNFLTRYIGLTEAKRILVARRPEKVEP